MADGEAADLYHERLQLIEECGKLKADLLRLAEDFRGKCAEIDKLRAEVESGRISLEESETALECRTISLEKTEKERDASDQMIVELKEELVSYGESLKAMYDLVEGITNETPLQRAEILAAESLVTGKNRFDEKRREREKDGEPTP